MNVKNILTFFKKPLGIAIVVFLILILLSVFITLRQFQSPAKNESNGLASYVGSVKCQSCHQKEFDLYKTSDHFHAMDSALPRSVRGDFNNSSFVYYGDTNFFYQRG